MSEPGITSGDTLQDLLDYEDGTLSYESTIKFFQNLVDTGMAWQLQGHYGRTAQQLINAGLVHRKEPARDSGK